MELVKIGVVEQPKLNPNFRLKVKHYKAYLITNYELNVDEVWCEESRADFVKSKLFQEINLIEKGGKYYFVTPTTTMVEITRSEFEQLKSSLTKSI